jgi:hypothetical protein
VNWIDLAQDMHNWQTVVFTVMNLWIPYNSGYFLTS